MSRVVHRCPICGKAMERQMTECAACTRLGETLIDFRDLPIPRDRTPDLIALLAFLNGLFAIVFTLLGGVVSPYLGAYLGLVTSIVGIACGVAGVIRTGPRYGRPGRWLAVAGILASVANLVLVLAMSIPLAVLYGRLFRLE